MLVVKFKCTVVVSSKVCIQKNSQVYSLKLDEIAKLKLDWKLNEMYEKKNPAIAFCCRFVCLLVWLCGGGGVPSHGKSETFAGPQRGDLLSRNHK